MPSTRLSMMPPSRQRRRPQPSPVRPGRSVLVAALCVAAVGLAACSDDTTSADDGASKSGAATVAPASTSPAQTGAVSSNAAWAAHKPVPAGFTRLASGKLSIGVPDGFEAVQDPRLGTTDLAATDGSGSVVAARVMPIAEGQTVPEEGPAWAAAGDIAKQAEATKGKDIEIVDSDIDQQDGWQVTWVSAKTADTPELKHIWHLVDIDDTSFALISIQGVPTAFADGKLAQVGGTLVIRGVTDGTAPSPTATK